MGCGPEEKGNVPLYTLAGRGVAGGRNQGNGPDRAIAKGDGGVCTWRRPQLRRHSGGDKPYNCGVAISVSVNDSEGTGIIPEIPETLLAGLETKTDRI